jgi:hypothetical protein
MVFSLKFLLRERLLLMSEYQVNAGLLILDTNRKKLQFSPPTSCVFDTCDALMIAIYIYM